MEIQEFLTKFKLNKNIRAGIASVDIIGSSELIGTDENISETKTQLRNLMISLFDDYCVALLDWRGDGGLLIFDRSEGLDDLVLICSKLASLLPFFNASRGRYNFLSNDFIHLRIVCHAGKITNTGDPETLTANVINHLAKQEKEIGVIDHVVVTEEVYRDLSDDLISRLTPSPTPNEKLGTYYILDENKGLASIELNKHTSENIRAWIATSVKQKRYDELYIFSYTNETLYDYLGSSLPGVKIKVLARSWMAEAKQENYYNEKYNKAYADKPKTGELHRPWLKSKNIRSMSEMLIDHEASDPFKNDMHIRFYDSPPLFKGAILRNSETGSCAAHIGFYAWREFRQEGGTPYVGEHWSGVWLTDDDGPQKIFLDYILSRFCELWVNGHEYDALKRLDEEFEANKLQKNCLEKIWQIDEKPYLIVVPGRETPNRPFTQVATEDLMALRAIEAILLKEKVEVKIEVLMDDQESAINTWEGHIIFICHRTLNDELYEHLYKQGFPYIFKAQEGEYPKITHKDHDQTFSSPMDRDPPEKWDYCVIGKCDLPTTDAKMFFIAGLHAMGTWGGGDFLSDIEKLVELFNKVGDNNFATLIQCDFEVPRRIVNTTIVMSPETY